MSNIAGSSKDWPTVSVRVHPEDYAKLKQRHGDGKDVSRVLRALINMYVDNKIPKVEAVFRDKIL